MPKEAMRDRILNASEKRARAGGYNGFSFREIAGDVGIKSASVHHHFPTKADLVEALAHRYCRQAQEFLGTPATYQEAVERVSDLFRGALVRDDAMCLCGVLGSETDSLPPPVAAATQSYFRMLLDYLDAAAPPGNRPLEPETVVSTLEGALLLARTLRQPVTFEAILQDALWRRF